MPRPIQLGPTSWAVRNALIEEERRRQLEANPNAGVTINAQEILGRPPTPSALANAMEFVDQRSARLAALRKAGKRKANYFVAREGDQAGMRYRVLQRGGKNVRRFEDGTEIEAGPVSTPPGTSAGASGMPGPAGEAAAEPNRGPAQAPATFTTEAGRKLRRHPNDPSLLIDPATKSIFRYRGPDKELLFVRRLG